MAKFETVPIGELKHRLPAKLLPLVEQYRDKLEKLSADQGARLTLEKAMTRKSSVGRSRPRRARSTAESDSRSAARTAL
jgi:hypothetical protein